MGREEGSPGVFVDLVRSGTWITQLRVASRKEDANLEVLEVLEANSNVRGELLMDLLKMKYWFVLSKTDLHVAFDLRDLYNGLVIVKDTEEAKLFRNDDIPALTLEEAEAKYGVEAFTEAEAEAEAIRNKYKDKLKELEAICEKLKEAEALPEAIRKKLKEAEAEVEAIRKKLKEAEAKYGVEVVAEASCPEKQAEEEEDNKRKRMKL